MPEIKQQPCQKPYNADYMVFIRYIVQIQKLLNPHGNGHFCSIPDETRTLVNLLNNCMLQNIKGPASIAGPLNR